MGRTCGLVIFDLDGTLADTLPDIAASVEGYLIKYGTYKLDKDLVRRSVGHGAKVLLQKIMEFEGIQPLDIDKDVEEYKAYFACHACQETRLYPHTLELLNRLKEQGVKLAVATMKPREPALTALEKLGISSYFSCVYAQEDMERPKPDGWVVREIAAKLQVPLSCTWVVGDGLTDVGAAKSAGALSIGMLNGYTLPEDMQKSGADYLFTDIIEVWELWEKEGKNHVD